MIIDAHAHIYPDKVAERAVNGIRQFYNITNGGDGTVSGLLRDGEKAGISRFLVQSVATVPAQVPVINRFISKTVAQYPDKLIGFGTMHPDYGDIEGELRCFSDLGLRGIKMHPDFQKYYIDEEKAYPIYEFAESLGLPILFHIGDNRQDLSSPERLLNVIKRFPKMKVIGAHFCGWSMWEHGAELLAHSGVYADCSSSLFALSPEKAAELIHKIDADHVLWGTDYPMWDACEELERFNKIPLTEEERENILGKNLMRLLGEIE